MIHRLPRSLVLLAVLALIPRPSPAASLGAVGNLLVIAGGGGGQVAEFDGASGDHIGSFLTTRPNDFTFAGPVLYTTDPSDTIITYDSFTGSVHDVLAGPTSVKNATGIEIDSDGTIVILNQVGPGPSLDRFSPSGAFLETVVSVPLNDFVFGPNGNIYATSALDAVVEIRPSDGVIVDTLTTAVLNPGPLLFLADGSLLVREAAGVQRFSESGAFLGTFTSSLVNDMTLGPNGKVYATDPSDTVLVFDGLSGALLSTFASTPPNPSSLAFRPIPEPSTALMLALGLLGLRGKHHCTSSPGARYASHSLPGRSDE